ncbi:BppU family phage baseplate upper protein [Clostridium perfringens]|uniref:BppU family phage baseplate upper protein n=1 Tax=Clostridium perfringens TaxID=1502 RepID=UPI002A65D523|nr:BppU family phage baseplate upper protein [Clostridium perfringens]MDJ9055270.1 BppU family phage baseplate upper protein [Clostridium perfringens]MDJ9062601.1 BppU family phage baseplate upper protein [Clostridium perfringens]
MKEIFINVDSYNSEGIKTIQGNNNAEIYKICISKSKVRLSLVGKTVKLGYVMAGTTKGDIIEDLNISNAEQGEITFPITNKISKKNGVYTCQLAIYGADGFLEYTATFGLTVEANIFTKIAGEIADSKDFTYLENILDKASKLSEKLKENTSSATNINSNLESNITEANNINSKLLENTSTATGLNKNLESNIDLAKEVKETIKDLDTKNIEATSKIERLEGLNAKAEELSDNINKGLPLNSELVKNVESAKIVNNELIATNNDAKAKKIDLDNSLEEAKKYIAGLDGSKNPVQMQLDINELKNGLKSNQSLSYEGSSIAANNTLEGRTEGMRIGGRTLVNLVNSKKIREYVATGAKSDNDTITWDFDNFEIPYNNWNMVYDTLDMCEAGKTYTVIFNVLENTTEVIKTGEKTGISIMNWNVKNGGNTWPEGDYVLKGSGIILKKLTFEKGSLEKSKIAFNVHGKEDVGNTPKRLRGKFVLSKKIMILEGDWTNKEIPSFFEGLKSFGEEEKVEDKYKISILSHGKNLFNVNNSKQGLLNVNTGILFETNTSNTSDYIKVEKGKNYIINGEGGEIRGYYGVLYDCSKRYVAQKTFSKNTPFTFEQDGYFRFSYASEEDGLPATNIIFEEGTQVSAYEPYKEDKKDILIKEPLRSLDENIYDVIQESNGQVIVNRAIGQYTFTGDENIQLWPGTPTDDYCYFVIDGIFNYKRLDKAICNNLPYSSSPTTGKELISLRFASDLNRIYISISKNKLTTPNIDGLKAYFKANLTTMIYPLATPTVEVVENCVDIDLDTFEEKTYFSIENSLPGTLDFKVSSNIASIVQNTAREVNNIWDVINNLLVPSILKANGNLAMIKLNNNLK